MQHSNKAKDEGFERSLLEGISFCSLSLHHDDRSVNMDSDLIVIHGVSLLPGQIMTPLLHASLNHYPKISVGFIVGYSNMPMRETGLGACFKRGRVRPAFASI